MLIDRLDFFINNNFFTMFELEDVSGITRNTLYKYRNGGKRYKSTESVIENSIYELLIQKKAIIETYLKQEKRKKINNRVKNFEDVYGENIDQLNYEYSPEYEEVINE